MPLLIHYGVTLDGWESYSDSVDVLDCETVRYAVLECVDAAEVVRIARRNLARADSCPRPSGFTVQVGDVFVEEVLPLTDPQ